MNAGNAQALRWNGRLPSRCRRIPCRSIARALTVLVAASLPAFANAAAYTFVVAGLGGEPEYEQRFREQANAIGSAARQVAQDASHVVVLIGDKARRDSVRRELRALASRMTPHDTITIVLIGHGSFDGETYRFNVPGIDITATDLGELFDRLPAREQLIVNATSASGAVIEQWQRPGRVVISATKNGGERTATRFAQFWAKAVTTDAADVNKDNVVSAAEAFDYSERQVAAAFKSDVSLATEHAHMEGEDAGRFTVARLGTAAVASSDPQVAALLKQRDGIERDLNAVKNRKGTLGDDAYYDELETVLVRLARLQKEIDARQASLGGDGR